MNKNFNLALAAILMAGPVGGCDRDNSPGASVQPDPPLPREVSIWPNTPPGQALVWQSHDIGQATKAGGNCALDDINGAPPAGAAVAMGSEVTFNGWIGNPANEVPTDARLLLLSDRAGYSTELVGGVKRPDVAVALQAEAMASSGFNLPVRMDLAPGTYTLSILQGTGDSAAACALNASLTIVR
jgi:hypothetical protein